MLEIVYCECPMEMYSRLCPDTVNDLSVRHSYIKHNNEVWHMKPVKRP